MIFFLISVLPPVLVPRHSEFAPSHATAMLQYSQQPTLGDNACPQNVSFSSNGFTHTSPNSPHSPASSSAHSPYQVNCLPGKQGWWSHYKSLIY